MKQQGAEIKPDTGFVYERRIYFPEVEVSTN